VRPHAHLRDVSGGLSLRELPRVARQGGKGRMVTIVEINAEPTPLTEEGISDYLIQGKTGEILPRLVDEVKRLRSRSRAKEEAPASEGGTDIWGMQSW